MKTKLPSLVTALILTLITTFSWIGFSVYRAITTKPDPVVPREITVELDPELDKDTIENIKSRIFLTGKKDNLVTPDTSSTNPPNIDTMEEAERTELLTPETKQIP